MIQTLNSGTAATIITALMTDTMTMRTYYDERAFLRHEECAFTVTSSLIAFNTIIFQIGRGENLHKEEEEEGVFEPQSTSPPTPVPAEPLSPDSAELYEESPQLPPFQHTPPAYANILNGDDWSCDMDDLVEGQSDMDNSSTPSGDNDEDFTIIGEVENAKANELEWVSGDTCMECSLPFSMTRRRVCSLAFFQFVSLDLYNLSNFEY